MRPGFDMIENSLFFLFLLLYRVMQWFLFPFTNVGFLKK